MNGPPGTERVAWREMLAAEHFSAYVLLCFGVWLHAADTLMTATVMPSVVAEIGGAAFLPWATAVYVLASIVAGAAAGPTARRLGLRAALAAGAGLYGIGCAVSATAPDMAAMLAGRACQGFGGGALVALAHVALTHLFPSRLWPRLLALISAIWGASSLLGPLAGGLFAEAGLWREAFWAFGLPAVALVPAFLLLMPKATLEAERGGVPCGRLALVAGGVFGIAVAGVTEAALSALAFGLCGIALLALAGRLDRAAAAPILPRAAYRLGSATAAGLLLVLCFAIATMSLTVYGPLLLQELFGAGPLVGGYVVAAESFAWTVAAIAVSGTGPGADKRLVPAGAMTIALGVAGLAWAVPFGGVLPAAFFAICQGTGAGLLWAQTVRRVVQSVGEAERALASAAMPTLQLLGYAVGAAAAGIVANGFGLGADPGPATALRAGPWLFAAMIPLGLGAVVAARRLVRA
ncbi:MFS transporter [Zavarzinia sp.]|uniref:MFS transporter n=1 Tax=Zavarzinia sp. TaxID=2027920 RepID=UPI003568CC1C